MKELWSPSRQSDLNRLQLTGAMEVPWTGASIRFPKTYNVPDSKMFSLKQSRGDREYCLSCLLFLGFGQTPLASFSSFILLPTEGMENPVAPLRGSLTRSLCAHTGTALCVWLQAMAFDKATGGKPHSGNKHR